MSLREISEEEGTLVWANLADHDDMDSPAVVCAHEGLEYRIGYRYCPGCGWTGLSRSVMRAKERELDLNYDETEDVPLTPEEAEYEQWRAKQASR